MADHSKIEWTEITWNFVTGCTKISDGCTNCYIERTMPFRVARRKFDKPGIGGKTDVKLHSDRLHWPLTKWKKPSRIFVNSLADIFHEDVPDQFIAEAFAVMSLAPQHTFQVLTKRHARMRSLLNSGMFWIMVNAARLARGVSVLRGGGPVLLDNVWIGVSVESQQWADIRIPALLETPAAVRWLSCEPLLGAVDLTRHLIGRPSWGEPHPEPTSPTGIVVQAFVPPPEIGWVVCGGESGPGARVMDQEWARSLRDQCARADVPYFFKQWGEDIHVDQMTDDCYQAVDAKHNLAQNHPPVWHVGKKLAGRELDGRTHDDYPHTLAADISSVV